MFVVLRAMSLQDLQNDTVKSTAESSLPADKRQSPDSAKVYVRRKSDAEVCKTILSDCSESCQQHNEDTIHSKPQIMEPKENVKPPSPTANASENAVTTKEEQWEERYRNLQNMLEKLDESNQEDYIRMLFSLSSTELSRIAVQLEARSIQLSLKEAQEMQRGGLLNVLGKSSNSVKAPQK